MAALLASAKSLGGVLERDAFLADECVSLVEEPFVVPGTFDEAFLELPDEVVISVMRDHQRQELPIERYSGCVGQSLHLFRRRHAAHSVMLMQTQRGI